MLELCYCLDRAHLRHVQNQVIFYILTVTSNQAMPAVLLDCLSTNIHLIVLLVQILMNHNTQSSKQESVGCYLFIPAGIEIVPYNLCGQKFGKYNFIFFFYSVESKYLLQYNTGND